MTKKEYLDKHFTKITAPKKVQSIQNTMNRTSYNSDNLYDFYKSFSYAKARALDYCEHLVEDLEGFNKRITGCNSMVFSYAFEFVDDEGVVNNALITRDHNYYCEAL